MLRFLIKYKTENINIKLPMIIENHCWKPAIYRVLPTRPNKRPKREYVMIRPIWYRTNEMNYIIGDK
jgi:hypothetical protein